MYTKSALEIKTESHSCVKTIR